MHQVRSVAVLLALAACDAPDDSGTDTNDTEPTACVEEGGACVLEGSILTDTTLTADVPWLLRGAVHVGDDASEVTLTIEPGTTVYGESATNAFLVVTRHANLVAEGTADQPITFTSDQAPGQRARGDWGGVAINGLGVINACVDASGPCEAAGDGGTGTYGGDDNGDSSGVLRYVVIEFGGTEISTDNEINGLGLQAVGSGTEIDHVQIHRNLDDGIEFWGGAVNVKHLVVTSPGDDGIDWDLGWRGKVQHAVIQQSNDAGNHGWETDNNESDHLAAPVSSPTIANVTVIGSTEVAEENYGLLFRRGSSPVLANVAVTGFSAGCLAIRDDATLAAFEAGTARIDHTVIACDTPFEDDEEAPIFEAGEGNAVVTDLRLTDSPNPTAPDLRPAADSPLLGTGEAPDDVFFDDADYIGAFDDTTDWTAGWTTHAAN